MIYVIFVAFSPGWICRCFRK